MHAYVIVLLKKSRLDACTNNHVIKESINYIIRDNEETSAPGIEEDRAQAS